MHLVVNLLPFSYALICSPYCLCAIAQIRTRKLISDYSGVCVFFCSVKQPSCFIDSFIVVRCTSMPLESSLFSNRDHVQVTMRLFVNVWCSRALRCLHVVSSWVWARVAVRVHGTCKCTCEWHVWVRVAAKCERPLEAWALGESWVVRAHILVVIAARRVVRGLVLRVRLASVCRPAERSAELHVEGRREEKNGLRATPCDARHAAIALHKAQRTIPPPSVFPCRAAQPLSRAPRASCFVPSLRAIAPRLSLNYGSLATRQLLRVALFRTPLPLPQARASCALVLVLVFFSAVAPELLRTRALAIRALYWSWVH